ncbi:P-loop containing nucleoside triphosphate hydrolases superfamily protein [Raphanus sativus]|uniref:AAA-ATPase At3g28510-like n=1 Tax=Raphanus sativus TaxID=3726 RepID=A0A6J0LS70_RAPSA|nr:AAA-ATPase At3g28510-like [Raphanus sativus]KAJ4888210.1 P-loop containing nucleoside triphosphate hydrolases superfamily protein [Raphanus sativus]
MLGTIAVWGITATTVSNIMLIRAVYSQYIPRHIRTQLEIYFYKLLGWLSFYVHIKFNEHTEEGLKISENYDAIRNYLSSNTAARAQRLKANESKNSKSLVLSMDDHEEVEDVFNGVKVKWHSNMNEIQRQSNYGRNTSYERRFFTLTFHRRHRGMIIESYITHVLREGKAIGLRNRERKLYTNNSSSEWYPWRSGKWSNVPFHHPATFETLAMDPEKKERIKKDLVKFSKGKDYYKKVGKPWKRGYLLFGPPGTGKSTMISAIANFLDYDVYDLELTTVKDNSELKKLLLDTKGKSIIVIEDIDCSLDLTGQRKTKKEEDEEEDKEKKKEKKKEEDDKKSKVTLSGLLNSIDGLWSACSDEKIIIFTTNFVDKLDPALIRRGRMDNHIEMSYCRFEAFKVLAKNYLDIESHELYGEIKRLLEETDMSPADVAETLMPKSDEEDADVCIKRLVKTVEEEKEKARKVAEEEEKNKAEKEEKKKEEEAEKKKTEEEEKKVKGSEENGDLSEKNGTN